jgi:hypothetical protein
MSASGTPKMDPSGSSNGDYNLNSRFNSYTRRTTTRYRSTFSVTEQMDEFVPDLLNLITAADGNEMEEFDKRSAEPVGSGSIYMASSIARSTSHLSPTIAGELVEESKSVILKYSPMALFDLNGKLVAGKHTRSTVKGMIMELRILTTPALLLHDNIVSFVGLNWDYSRLVSDRFLLLCSPTTDFFQG